MQQLTILYDAHCGLCSWARRWMLRQRSYLHLVFLPAGSEAARRRYPGLGDSDAPEELVVISDDGGVYRGGDAWIMCLYALEDYREWSLRLAQPSLRPLARRAFALLSKQRGRVARWLHLASEEEIAATLHQVYAPACATVEPAANGRAAD